MWNKGRTESVKEKEAKICLESFYSYYCFWVYPTPNARIYSVLIFRGLHNFLFLSDLYLKVNFTYIFTCVYKFYSLIFIGTDGTDKKLYFLSLEFSIRQICCTLIRCPKIIFLFTGITNSCIFMASSDVVMVNSELDRM